MTDRWRRAWLTVTGAALVTMLGVAILLATGSSRALSELDPPAQAITVTTESSPLDHAHPAELSAAPRPTTELRASEHIGLVTKLSVTSGMVLDNGAELYRVNGIPVRCLVDDQVLYRAVDEQASAPEIAAVQRFLAATGHFAGDVTGRMDAPTKEAIIAFGRTIDDPSPAFKPGWVVWAPPTSEVVTVHQSLGAPVQSNALSIRPQSTDFTLTGAGDAPAGQWLFASQGQVLEVTRDDAGSWTIVDPRAAQELFDAESSDSASIAGWLRLAEPLDATAVPAAAIVDDAGSACVFTPSGDAVSVRPEGTAVDGRVLVSGFPAGSAVVLNPHDLGYTRCDS